MTMKPESIALAPAKTKTILTNETLFDDVCAGEDRLFAVRKGIPAGDALTKAACLAESIQSIAACGVQDGIDQGTAYLIEFAAEVIQALVNSLEKSV